MASKTNKPAEEVKTAEVKTVEAPKAAAKVTEKAAPAKKAPAKKAAAPKAATKKAPAKKEATAPKAATKKAPAKKAAAPKAAAKKAPAKKAPAKKAKELTYEILFADIKKKFEKTSVDKKADVSVEVNIEGTITGKFYLKATNGKLDIEPYNYDNADVEAYVPTDVLVKLAAGKLNVLEAIANGDVHVFGKIDKALQLKNIIK